MAAVLGLGYLFAIGGGGLLFIMTLIAGYAIWGLKGLLIVTFIPPVAEVFPFYVWYVSGVFPAYYFLVWAITNAGITMVAVGEAMKSRAATY